MKNFYRVTEAANQIGISATTLRNYTKQGRITSTRNPAGQRIYTQASINSFLGINAIPQNIVFYVRSSDGDKVRINNQIDLLTEKYGTPTKVFKDNASGLNEKRPGLNSLLKTAEKKLFDTVIITQKDRLTRFGYTYLEELLKNYGVKIIVLGETNDKSLQEELLQDFMSLIASFSGKYYRLRGYEQKKLLLNQAGEKLEETR